MGWSAIKYMLKKPTKINLKILARKSKKKHRAAYPLYGKAQCENHLGRFS